MLLVCRQPLLTNEKTQQDALLAVSSLVNNYCESSAGCAEDEEVQKVLDSLTGILGKDCDVNDSNFKQVSTHRLRVRSSKCAKFIHLCPILLLTILIRNAFQFLQIHVAAFHKKRGGGDGDAEQRLLCVLEVFLDTFMPAECRFCAQLIQIFKFNVRVLNVEWHTCVK